MSDKTRHKEPEPKPEAPKPGCRICLPRGAPGLLTIVVPHWAPGGKAWPWDEARRALDAGDRPKQWSLIETVVRCECLERGAAFRVLDAWMRDARQCVIDGLLSHQPELMQRQFKRRIEDTRALALELGAGRQYTTVA